LSSNVDKAKDFHLPPNVQTAYGVLSASNSTVTRIFFGAKQPAREANHGLSSIAEFKNENGFISVTPYTPSAKQDTSVGLDGPGIEPRWKRDISHPSRPTLGPARLLYKGYRSLSAR
jgi:hypothetical protein